MTVRKPLGKLNFEKVDIQAMIEKGASVKEDIEEDKKKWKVVNLRMPMSMLHEVDKVVDETVGITRNGWFLQVINEKLKRLKDEAT